MEREENMNKIALVFVAGSLVTGLALAEPATYNVDPAHTYPAFEADHMGGLSIWRGKFNSSTGKVVYDKAAKAGTVEITIDAKSIDFGMDKMNEHANSAEIFDTAKFPTAVFKGKLAKFNGESPTEVQGELTLHGVTKPVTLKVLSFLCKPNPMTKKETCGADALATIDREDFGVSYGKSFGFKMEVTLRITIEAVKAG
jgi:polyisoprenoid-binding protein YceI